VCTLADIQDVRRAVSEVRIADSVRRYIVGLVGATRGHGTIRLGASPRASLALQRLSQALALIDGEEFVAPDHVREIAVPDPRAPRDARLAHAASGTRPRT
jgi:MoxR-like ATPase